MSLIIVATDFSPQSDRAFLRAMGLARQTGQALLFAHVIEDCQTADERAERRLAAEKGLADLCAIAADHPDLQTEWAILEGEPELAMSALATRRGASLLIIGAHEPEPIRDMLRSRMAVRLAKVAPCPVLITNGPAASPYRRLLVALDPPEGVHRMAAALHPFFSGDGSEVLFYHVFDSRPFGGIAASTGARAEVEEARNRMRVTTEQAMAAAVAIAGMKAPSVMAEPAAAATATMILTQAEAWSADLLVAGTQDKSATERLLLGSVAEDLLKGAPQDLLLVPPPGD